PIRENSLDDRDRGGWRGRRRRGRRDQPPARPAQTESRPEREREDFGPPRGYQPILLPGESISKYRDRGPASVPQSREENFGGVGSRDAESLLGETHAELSEKFPQDEPLFSQNTADVQTEISPTSGPELNSQPDSETDDTQAP